MPNGRHSSQQVNSPVATPAEQGLHRNFVESVRTLRKGLVRSAFYLLEIQERRVHRALGFRTITAYAAASAGLSESRTRDLLKVGRKLRASPELSDAVIQGQLSWSRARSASAQIELGGALFQLPADKAERIGSEGGADTKKPAGADEETEAGPCSSDVASISVATARMRSADPDSRSTRRPQECRQMPKEVKPTDAKVMVTLAMSPEQHARWEGAVAAIRERGELAPLAELNLDAMTSFAAGGVADSGECRDTLLVILACPACEKASIVSSRGEFEAPRPLLEAARCDAVVEREIDGRIIRNVTIPSRIRRLVLRRDRFRCQTDGCGHTRHLEIHHRIPTAQGGKAELENLITLCRSCHRALHEREQALHSAVRGTPAI